MGDPDGGQGKNQPGSWVYQIVDFLEESNVRTIAAGLPDAQKRVELTKLSETPITVMNCPTRRPARAYAYFYNDNYRNMNDPRLAVRGDYGACMSGRRPPTDGFREPNTLAEGSTTFDWDKAERDKLGLVQGKVRHLDGVVVYHRPIELRSITDGLSKTYLLGEKALTIPRYEDGKAPWDDQSYYIGFDQDTNLSSYNLPIRDPSRDISVVFRFGSAHPSVVQMVFCDGSVHPISYDIELEVHRTLGTRNGDEPVDSLAL
jgi:hypothetical protein